MNTQVKKLFTDRLNRLSTSNQQKGCVILYNKERLILSSGKQIWSSKRNASIALSNALYGLSDIVHAVYGESREKRTADYIKELEAEGIIEFKELT